MPDLDREGHYWWSYAGDADRTSDKTSTPLDPIAQTLVGKKPTVVLVLPDSMSIIRAAQVKQNQQQHLRQTLPWLFEEELPIRVDEWHFSYQLRNRSSAVVVAVNKSAFTQQIENLRDFGFDPTYATPAAHLLAEKKGVLNCCYGNPWIGLSISAAEHHVCNQMTLSKLLALLRTQHDIQKISVWACAPGLIEEANKVFKKARTKLKIEYHETPLLDGYRAPPESLPVNLLQGEFTPKIQWESLWSEWRLAVGSIALLACIYTADGVADYYALLDKQRHLHSSLGTLQRNAYPERAFDSQETFRQTMEDELRSLTGQTGRARQNEFSLWLERIGYGLKVGGDSFLRLANYNGKKNTMRIEFDTKNYEEIESIRDVLKKRGVDSQIINSTAKSGSIRTRMECKLGEPS